MIKPNFLYIGIARAGSTWLFNMLQEHPDVYVPPAKDLYFFDQYYDKGLDWYLSHFQAAGDASAVGELSHDYYFCPEAPARIRAALPDVKLVCCLREPLSRLRSGYAYNKTTELGRGISLEDYARREEVMVQFDYFRHLQRYVDLFGWEQLLIVFYEDLQQDPGSFIRSIYRFIGVDEDFAPPSLHQKINAARDARVEPVALLAYRVALILRRLGMANLVGRVKQHPLVNRVLYTPAVTEGPSGPPVSDALAAELRRDFAQLEALVGRPLPESWYA